MTIIYRIFGILINIVAVFITIGLVFMVPFSLAAPPLWLPVFMSAAIVLYTWFSNKFQRLVLVQQKTVKASLRDWVRVNGFVAIISTFLNLPPILALLRNPVANIAAMKDVLKQLGPEYEKSFRVESLTTVGIIMLVYFLVLFIHVLWTFALMKKNSEFFE